MKRDAQRGRLLIALLGGATLIVLTMASAVVLVTRPPESGEGGASSAVAANPAASQPSPGAGLAGAPAAPPIPEISVVKLATAPPADDPLDPAWDKIAVATISLAPQQVAAPVLEAGTVPELRVQAAHDDHRYVWRLSWDRAAVSDHSEVGRFSDGVAMQFPLVDGAPFTMGAPGMPVRLLHWKATWQKDIDAGYQGLAGLYPNTDADLYWFAAGKQPHAANGSVDNPQARQWMIAAQAGNTMSGSQIEHPIEELTAEGFGSATHVDATPSRGSGVWKDGQWFVVIDRPADAGDALIKRFHSSPDKQMIAFAVWDGEHANRGGRKQITNWLPMRIAL